MKKYIVYFPENGIMVAGEILAESWDHAQEICETEGFELIGLAD